MLQLRNRYNVEKRKFDYLRSKNPNARAKWSMFQHMNFLEGHIRQRRRTRGMGKAFYNSVRSEEARLNGLTPRRRGRPPKIDRKYSDHDNTNDGEDDDDDEEQDGSLLNENEIKDEIRSETYVVLFYVTIILETNYNLNLILEIQILIKAMMKRTNL